MLGAVVITYNLPEVTKPLNLTGPVVADIFLGKITKWNAPEIAALNKGVKLPNKDILVVHRTDGSGTTYIFTDYLSAVSPAWATGPGKGKELQWPVGLGGKGNEGVTGQVQQLPARSATSSSRTRGRTSSRTRRSRTRPASSSLPTIESVTAAAAGVAAKLPATTDFRVSIVNAAGQRRVSDLVVHVHPRLPDADRRGEGQEARRLPQVGDSRRRGDRADARLRAASEERRRRCSTSVCRR